MFDLTFCMMKWNRWWSTATWFWWFLRPINFLETKNGSWKCLTIHIRSMYIVYREIYIYISLLFNLPLKSSIHVGKYTSHTWMLWDWNHLGISPMAFGRKIHANFRGKLGTGKRQAEPIWKSMEITWTCLLVVFLFPLPCTVSIFL